MLRGTTLAAERQPCELLVGGEAPATCQAKDYALGVQQLELPFLLAALTCPVPPSQGPGPEHLPLGTPQWGSDRPWLLEGHPSPPGCLASCCAAEEKKVCAL